jgi:hypothetical protein
MSIISVLFQAHYICHEVSKRLAYGDVEGFMLYQEVDAWIQASTKGGLFCTRKCAAPVTIFDTHCNMHRAFRLNFSSVRVGCGKCD